MSAAGYKQTVPAMMRKKGGLSQMEFRQLHYFLKVCEYNSIARAAQSVFISPQALSKSIVQLEKEFQMPLFSRTSHGLVLTEAGEQLRKLGTPIMESIHHLHAEMNGLYQSSHGLLSLGVTSTLDFFLEKKSLEQFYALHPEYKIIVSEHSHTICEEAVASGEMIAALTYGESDKRDVTTMNLMNRQRVCLVPLESPLARKDLIHISDLKGHQIVSSINNFSLNLFYSRCRERGFEPEVYRVDDIMTMVNFCCERGYIGISIDYLLLWSSFRKMNLVAIPIALDEFYSPINLMVNSERYKQKIVQELVEHIKQTAMKKKELVPNYPFAFLG